MLSRPLGTVKYSFDSDYATPDYTTYRENGRYGIKDAAGNIVMEPSYSSIDAFYGDYATVYNGEKYGLINGECPGAAPLLEPSTASCSPRPSRVTGAMRGSASLLFLALCSGQFPVNPSLQG